MPQESSQIDSNEFVMAELTPDEEHILQLLEDMDKDTIWVNRTQKGIVPGTLETIKMYYTDTEAVHILESLVRNGIIDRIDNGILLMCPSCGSHEASILKTCPNCESSKLRKRNKIVHTPCEHWGTFDEFNGGNTITCPICQEVIESDKILENKAGFSYSDPYYECQDCGFSSNKVPSIYLCTNCKTKYRSSNAVQLEQTGYRILVDPVSNPEEYVPPRKTRVEKMATRDKIEQLENLIQVNSKKTETNPTPRMGNKRRESEEERDTLEPDNRDADELVHPQETQLELIETEPEVFEEKTLEIEKDPPLPEPEESIIEVEQTTNEVLLVVEEQMVYNLIIESLEKSGETIEVTLIEDGAFVLKALRNNYDLIIFDSELSTIDPSLVLDEISKWKITTPIIILDNGYLKGTPIGLNLVELLNRKQRDIEKITDLVVDIF